MDADAKTKTCYEKKKPSIYKWRENNKEKYNNICLLLANFYILSDKRKEWKLALPYYRMCHLSAIKIIQQAMELWKKSLSSE